MKAPSPAFSFYPKDWLSDSNVKVMTYDEKGVYIDLISMCWMEDLPADPTRLSRLLKIPLKRFERIWSVVGPCFSTEGGFLRQKRVELEKAKQVERSRLQSEKGTKSAKSRKSNTGNQPRLDPGSDSVPTQFNLPSPSPFPSPSSSAFNNTQQQQQQAPREAAAPSDSSSVRIEGQPKPWIDFDPKSALQQAVVYRVEDLTPNGSPRDRQAMLRTLSDTGNGTAIEGSLRHASARWLAATIATAARFEREQSEDEDRAPPDEAQP